MYSSNFLGMWGRSSFPSICKPDHLFLRKLDVSKGEARVNCTGFVNAISRYRMLSQDIDIYGILCRKIPTQPRSLQANNISNR